MSLFNIRPGIETTRQHQSESHLDEAELHGHLSALSASYIKLIKDTVISKLDDGNKFSIRDYQILIAISKSKEAVTSSQVFKATGLDPATVTRSVKVLDQEGLLNIQDNQEDARSRLLSLTEKGEELSNAYKEACEAIFAPDDLSFNSPSINEIRAIIDSLNKLTKRVKILRLKNFN